MENEQKHIPSSVKDVGGVLMVLVYLATSGFKSPVFIVDLTASQHAADVC